METFGTHSNEQRLAELRSFQILDTLTEKEYDNITQLAAMICDMPIALISLVDGERQWFKSRFGLPYQETSLDESFCIFAIKTPNDPFTGGMKVNFYAAAPLVSENGFGLGTVCVIDTVPRTLTEQQIKSLQLLSQMTMNLLNIRRAKLGLDIARTDLQQKNNLLTQNHQSLQDLLDSRDITRLSEIADQNRLLAKANKELEAFAYISSHDLQEPLRKIQTFASMLDERESERLSDRGKEYLTKITDSASRMSTLIQGLLEYSRNTKAEVMFEPTTLRSLVADVLIDLEVEIQAKKPQIEICNDCGFQVIPFQFRQLIYNLMTNSLKFSRPGIVPKITLSCEKVNGSDFSQHKLADQRYYHIQMADNGIGFKPEYKNKIFGLFQRLGSPQQEMGTGIGLAIVKKIVDNHKGVITASGDEGNGAIFDIFIPVQD
jgi:signal transduction histidine kinase